MLPSNAQESTPDSATELGKAKGNTPKLVYQKRNKHDFVQQQLQMSEPMVSTLGTNPDVLILELKILL